MMTRLLIFGCAFDLNTASESIFMINSVRCLILTGQNPERRPQALPYSCLKIAY